MTTSAKSLLLFSSLLLTAALSVATVKGEKGEETVAWDAKKQKLEFKLKELSGVLNLDHENPRYSTHHFSKVRHTPTETLLSPDDGK